MTEENKKPNDNDQPEVEEVVTDFGDMRIRSGFEIEEQEPGVLGVNIFGPFIEFLDEDDDDLEDLEQEDEDEQEHNAP